MGTVDSVPETHLHGKGVQRPHCDIKHAMDSGLNLMECDVHLSKDGEVVVAHDCDLERMCGP